MKCFLINLDYDADRLSVATRQLNQVGVPFERVSGVCGGALSTSEKRLAVSRFRCLCAYGHMFTDGEIGCQLSHQKVYRKMLAENIPLACVLEDDVVLDGRVSQLLSYLEQMLEPARPQLVLLSNHTGNAIAKLEDEAFCIVPSAGAMFAEGYVLTRQAAANLLRANCPMIVPADHFGRWVKTGAIELYHSYPTVCRQDKVSFETSTQPEGCFDVRKLSRPLLVLYKFSRVLGKTMDWLLICITGR